MSRITSCILNIPVFSTGYLSTYIYSFIFLLLLPFSYCFCPQNAQKASHDCFSGYNTALLSMQQSHHTLFSGVDVELLRTFCSSYLTAMKCIQSLKDGCPSKATTIEQSLINLEGAQEELSELCKDDKIYEVYARHLTCFMTHGDYSEQCFERIMNTSVQLMGRIDNQPLQTLCRNLHKTLECIKSNILAKCDKEAGGLVEILVKPMVRRSTQCVGYTVVTTTQRSSNTKRPGHYPNKNNDTDSANSIYLNSLLLTVVLLLSMHSSKIS